MTSDSVGTLIKATFVERMPFGHLVTRIEDGATHVYALPTKTLELLSSVVHRKIATSDETESELVPVVKKAGDPSYFENGIVFKKVKKRPRRSNSNELLRAVLRAMIEAKSSSPSQMVSKAMFFLAEFLGGSDTSERRELEAVMRAAVAEVRGYKTATDNVTGVVLSYRRISDPRLTSTDELAVKEAKREHERKRRMRKSLHNPNMDLELFQATVYVPRRNSFSEMPTQEMNLEDLNDLNLLNDYENEEVESLVVRAPEYLLDSSSPVSFPPSPRQRDMILNDFKDYTDDVLYRARDKIRAELGGRRRRLGTLNPLDSHVDVVLSKGAHTANRRQNSKSTGPVVARAALACEPGRSTYFEVAFGSTGVVDCCVGVSTRRSVLNSIVGETSFSVGISSEGRPYAENQPRFQHTFTNKFSNHNVVRVGVHVSEETREVDFSATAVRDARIEYYDDDEFSQDVLIFQHELVVPVNLKLFASVSLNHKHSAPLSVKFAPEDKIYDPPLLHASEWHAVDGQAF